MTTDEMRVAVAEACGYRYITDLMAGRLCTQWFNPDGTKAHPHEVVGGALGYLPDYPADLNAMHEAEATLSGTQFDDYVDELIEHFAREAGLSMIDAACLAVGASAAVRAEAFLRATGRWKDEVKP